MADHENLYEEMRREDEAAAQLYKIEAKTAKPIEVNVSEARRKYDKDIAPVIARIKRAQAGKPITKNPLYNLYLKVTGQDKVPTPEVMDPRQGIAVATQSPEEVRKEMIEHPEKYGHLGKVAPKTKNNS